MKKIYCKNCKYWYEMSNYYFLIGDHCSYELFKKNKKISEITGQSRGSHTSINFEEENKNNNCPYYKKKWWKFWL